MISRRSVVSVATLVLLLAGAFLAATPQARADTPLCAATSSNPTPFSPPTGGSCWTDYPYPFGSDGTNPVDPSSVLCTGTTGRYGRPPGQNWSGDFDPAGGDIPANPPCYLQVNSLAFRAWNRGLAATGQPRLNPNNTAGVSVAFGVWLYNGTTWFPDPTFPGSNVCPGSTILWAGKLDYWLVGSVASPQRTLCRFDGANLTWEPIPLPAATVARLPTTLNPQTGTQVPVGGITSGACYAWNNCWFFGDDGIEVHWDGQSLSDASAGLGASPWLQGDFTGAVAGTDASGRSFGLAVSASGMTSVLGLPAAALPPAPDGSPPAQLWGSQGGPWSPLPYSPPANPRTNDPHTTDLTAVSANAQGDVWVAGDPAFRVQGAPPGPSPLVRLTETGTPPASCPGYGPTTFTSGLSSGFTWEGLSTFPEGGAFPDGDALAGAQYRTAATQYDGFNDAEPAFLHAACGQPPTFTGQPPTNFTLFRIPDPTIPAGQANPPLVPADFGGNATAVAANAPNDAWAATTDGNWPLLEGGQPSPRSLRPHFYHWTDGQLPQAPAGDDNESRPSLFTLDPPVYVVGSPTIIVTQGPQTITHTHGKPKKVRLPAPIYAIHSKVLHSPNGTLTLYLTFKVRPPVTIGLEGLRKGKVVASTGLKRFTGHSGHLSLKLDRKRWPTKLRLVIPKTKK